MEKIYSMHKLVGLQLFWSGTPTFSSGTPTFSSGTPTFCQMGVLNSCFQNPSESSESCPDFFFIIIIMFVKYVSDHINEVWTFGLGMLGHRDH